MRKFFIYLFILAAWFYAAPASFADEQTAEIAQLESLGNHDKTVNTLKDRKQFNKLSRGSPRIYPLSMRKNAVYELQTALGYVSAIDLPEPALKVFIGDQELFKVGVYETEVLIKPITDDLSARSNLTIVTQSGRLTFDVFVGPPDTADFVLDFKREEEDVLVQNAFEQKITEAKKSLEEVYQEKESHLEEKAETLSVSKVKESVAKDARTVELNESKETGDVRVNLVSFSVIGDKSYLRFGVRNLSTLVYRPERIVVGLQTYERKTLGLKKEKEGLIEIESETELPSVISPSSYVYGVAVFERRLPAKGEKPVFLIFEDEGTRHFRFEGFKWLS